jgi:hypothetical protein
MMSADSVPATALLFGCAGCKAAVGHRGILEKVKKLAATIVAVSLTNPFFYKHFLSVNSTPFNTDLFKGPTVSQNIFSGVLYRVETASVFWRSDNQMDVVLHRGSQLVV